MISLPIGHLAMAGGVQTGELALPDVEVTGRAANNLIGTADTASQGVVLKVQLDQRPVYRVGELLEAVPGLIVTQHSGEGKANQYFLRGFNLDHGTDIDISVDDMPVNMRTHVHGQGYADLNFMIPELVSNIQYRKGPYFADQGDFASAGAVRINYLDTLPHDIASISLGTLGDYRGFTALSRPVGAGNLLLALAYEHVDGPWTIPDNFNKGNVLMRYSQGTQDDGFSVTGMYMRNAFHATNQIPERAVASGLVGRFGAIDPSDGGDTERYSLSGKYARPLGAGLLKANAYFIDYSMTLLSDFTFALDCGADSIFCPDKGDQFVQRDRRTIYGGNTSYTVPHTMFGFPSETTIGFQTRTDDIHLGLARSMDQAIFAGVRNDHVVESSVGLYAENRTKWLDKFRTVTGVRGDLYYGSDHSTLASNSGELTRAIASPKFSAILGPWAETEFYASWGQGFHSNDVRGALSRVDATATLFSGNNTIARQNPVPLLTKSTGYEIGVRTAIVPHLQAEASLFFLDIDSELTFSGDAGSTSAGRPSQRKGLELSLFYTPFPWLIVDIDYAHSNARFRGRDDGLSDTVAGRPGNSIPGSVQDVASVGVTVKDLGPWEGGLRVRYFGPRPLIEDDSVRSKATALTDLRVGYKISDSITARLDIYNLFNSRAHQIDYYYPSQLKGETAPVNDRHFHPVEPTSARLGVTMLF